MKLRWRKTETGHTSTDGAYVIRDERLVYAVMHNDKNIGYANSLKEAGQIAQKHYDKEGSI